ncbi:MAG: hypothetical protein ACOX6Q_03410 [Candidatus Dojkabacteria bacterium]|mgnify:CR=1 FL=1|jgi:hypothetical protein
MYDIIYFDLDDTLVQDNPVTGKSEILNSGLEKYKELVRNSPNATKVLLTNRCSASIKYPDVYVFDEVLGWDNMKEYISNGIKDVKISHLTSLKNIFIFLRGIYLYKRNQTPKLLYVFLRSVIKKEKIFVLDDDFRVSGMF